MKSRNLFSALVLCIGLCSAAHAATKPEYDPRRDPFDQYHQAIAQAEAENKLVLIIAGGDWCRWCHVLSRFVAKNADVDANLHQAFVVMKVYVGDQNFNEFFFSQLPEARGAPHFWIVSPGREVLSSQSTVSFEHGKSGYDKREFMDFIDHWKNYSSTERVARVTE